MAAIDETHDPQRQSWVAAANERGCDFPIQNLALGVFRRQGGAELPRGGVAIGDRILDVGEAHRAGLFDGAARQAAAAASDTTLNRLMGLGPAAWNALRQAVSALLRAGGEDEAERRRRCDSLLVPIAQAELFVPAAVGDYTDFFASIYHATNGGRINRPDNPLMPNYKWVPVAYHSRASSVVASGAEVKRPNGQTNPAGSAAPQFGPCRMLDYEAEIGFYIGPGNKRGEAIPLDRAEDHIFGYCILNDWSARDIQSWESAPLGPFLGKSFATMVSPWIVTTAALAPFRIPATTRPPGDPAPLPYLASPADQSAGGVDLSIEVLLRTERMRREGAAAYRMSLGTMRDLYWTPAQMVAHHTVNGCNLNPGDLCGTGTVSGPEKPSWGCLMELTTRGRDRIDLPNGEMRTFVEDGDEIAMRARCERDGYVGIGFGECRGVVSPAG
jgi:fumarylacetoacetase